MSKQTYLVITISVFLGLSFWIADAFQYYYFLTERIRFLIFQAPMSFMDALIFNIQPSDLIIRIAFIAVCLIGGILNSIFLSTVRKRNIIQKNLEDRLRQSQKMEALGTLAGGVAHDFNNLLTTITGYSQLMIYDKTKDDPDYEKLQKIVRSVERGSKLTTQLLSLSRNIEVVQTPLDLNENILEVKKLLDSTISKMIEIEIQVAETPQVIEGDPGQLEQVIMNLAINARDAMVEGKGGKIVISTKTIDTPKQFIRKDISHSHTSTYPKKGSYILLTVSDTGSGINKEKLDFIFDPFFTTKEIGKGTGLGLAMVYEIVKNHLGYIICYSELDVGTTFEIYFPASLKKLKIQENNCIMKIIGGDETILVVDDEADVRKITELALQKEGGYNVISCYNAEEALKTYRKEKNIDLVILDIIMPGMGGVKCLEYLIKLNPEIKVIMTSGFSDDDKIISKVIHLGAKKFISKPFKIADMLKQIRTILDSSE